MVVISLGHDILKKVIQALGHKTESTEGELFSPMPVTCETSHPQNDEGNVAI